MTVESSILPPCYLSVSIDIISDSHAAIYSTLLLVPGEFVSELEVEKFFTEIGDIGLVELQFQVYIK